MKPESDNSETQPEAVEPEPADTSAESRGNATPDDDALAASQAEAADLKDRLLRAAADMENMRKRNERQLEDAHKYAVTGFARDILTVADNLQRALAAVPAEQRAGNELMATLLGGVEAVDKALLAILEKHKISRIEPLGEPFDPNRHEAVYEVPDSGYPAGAVAQVLQPGYLLNDRLLRPAMVGVAKGAGATASGGVDTMA
jgi:molecular chaperone GrpE